MLRLSVVISVLSVVAASKLFSREFNLASIGTPVRALEELHYTPVKEFNGGFITMYSSTHPSCNTPNYAMTLAVDACLLGTNVSFPGIMYHVSESQFQDQYFVTQSLFYDRECTVLADKLNAYVPNSLKCTQSDVNENFYSYSQYSTNFPESFDKSDDAQLIRETFYDDYQSCSSSENEVEGHMAVFDSCLLLGEIVGKMSSCSVTGDSDYSQGTTYTVELFASYEACNSSATPMASFNENLLSCDGITDFGAAVSQISRMSCVNVDTEVDDNSIPDVPTFDGFAVVTGYSFNETETCNDEFSAIQVIAINACVPSSTGYIFIEHSFLNEVDVFTVGSYSDASCGAAEMLSWAIHPSCNQSGTLSNPCTFSVNSSACYDIEISGTVTNAIKWAYSESFPELSDKHDIVHKYFESESTCFDNDVEGITSAVIMPIHSCQFDSSLLLVENTEYPEVDGSAYKVTNCNGYSYTVEMYDPATCGEGSVQLSFEQPQYSCAFTSKGYYSAICVDYNYNERSIPKNALYALLLFILLLPIFFYLGLKIAESVGCFKKSAPYVDIQQSTPGNDL